MSLPPRKEVWPMLALQPLLNVVRRILAPGTPSRATSSPAPRSTGPSPLAAGDPQLLRALMGPEFLIGRKERKSAKSGLSLTKLRYFKPFRMRTYIKCTHHLKITPLESSKVALFRPQSVFFSSLESVSYKTNLL